ncbi:hypothetical protein [Mesonia sp. HuA40]|uniref:hypothetical protein n=1 Tax=Mesonia sp. HuA40 TaxID=2602761 RepID=UPI001C9D4A12|nr:hypothetical protein [Mesonia sp. HuA40]
MNPSTTKQKAPKWFIALAVFLLVWNLMGVLAFINQISMGAEEIALLPENQQVLYANYPTWALIAFAMAVSGGFLGSLLLLLKNKWAKTLFLISLVGIVVQMTHSLFIAKATQVYGPGAAICL